MTDISFSPKSFIFYFQINLGMQLLFFPVPRLLLARSLKILNVEIQNPSLLVKNLYFTNNAATKQTVVIEKTIWKKFQLRALVKINSSFVWWPQYCFNQEYFKITNFFTDCPATGCWVDSESAVRSTSRRLVDNSRRWRGKAGGRVDPCFRAHRRWQEGDCHHTPLYCSSAFFPLSLPLRAKHTLIIPYCWS